MIELHKIQGSPKKQTPGTDHIWFTDHGATYVADNKGTPQPVGAGTIVSRLAPTGTPPAANILHYATDSRRHYISTDTHWMEIPLKEMPGFGGIVGGTAGTVMISDHAGFYKSYDVEGALYEIGDISRHILGDAQLPLHEGDLEHHLTPGEFALKSNSPSGEPSWLIQRRDEENNLFGFITGLDGRVHVRYGDRTSTLAGSRDIEDLRGFIDETTSNQEDVFKSYIKIMDESIASVVETSEQVGRETEEMQEFYRSRLEQTSKDFEMTFENFQGEVDETTGALGDEINRAKSFIRFSDDGIELGKENESAGLKIMRDKVSFMEDYDEVAYISNKRLEISDASVAGGLEIGKFAFMPRPDGSLDFGLNK